jgi:hypothetical protein
MGRLLSTVKDLLATVSVILVPSPVKSIGKCATKVCACAFVVEKTDNNKNTIFAIFIFSSIKFMKTKVRDWRRLDCKKCCKCAQKCCGNDAVQTPAIARQTPARKTKTLFQHQQFAYFCFRVNIDVTKKNKNI